MFDLSLAECITCRSGGFRLEGESRQELVCEHCGGRFDVRDGIACFLRVSTDYIENYDQISRDDLVESKTPTVVKDAYSQLVRWRARGVSCDLGCGDGYVIQKIDATIKFAVDIAMPYLQRLPASIERIWGYVEDVPLKPGCIDTIISTDVLEHVLDAQRFANEIDRLLAPNGRVLIAAPFEQDLSVYDLPEYKQKYGKYKYVHVRSVNDETIAELFPTYEVRFSHLITDGMKLMEFRPYPIKFYDLRRRTD